MNGKFTILLLTMLLFVTFVLALQPKQAKAGIITVPDDYSTIQEAINHANNGDTVFVRAASYDENIILNVSISLIGEAKETTIVDVRGIGNPLEITVNGTVISGFTFSFGGAGIVMTNSHNNLISDNMLKKNSRGIGGSFYTNTILENNTVTENDYGIDFGHLSGPSSKNNTAKNNEIYSNTNAGIYVSASEGNNSIITNRIHENGFGIILDHTQQNEVSDNGITDNTYGIYMRNAIQDKIERNLLEGNSVGMHVEGSNGNNIFHNNFESNAVQVEGISFNTWDDGYPSGGNYWSDYAGIDLNSGPSQNETQCDGIGDTPYMIDIDNRDNYPLMTPYPDLTPPGIVILSPENKSYMSNYIPLTFTLSEKSSWIGYTINGQENITAIGNTTLNVSEGFHWVKVYANDSYGNMGSSETISFMVDTTNPSIAAPLRSPSGDIQPNQSVKISVNVTDTGSGVESVKLAYFTNRSLIGLEFPMMLNQTSGFYERTILVQEASTLVRYQITAFDRAGNNVTNDNAGQ